MQTNVPVSPAHQWDEGEFMYLIVAALSSAMPVRDIDFIGKWQLLARDLAVV